MGARGNYLAASYIARLWCNDPGLSVFVLQSASATVGDQAQVHDAFLETGGNAIRGAVFDLA